MAIPNVWNGIYFESLIIAAIDGAEKEDGATDPIEKGRLLLEEQEGRAMRCIVNGY